eukprot:gnl/TRDRNA2_/TRDRNA2_190716_c0_seq1.p1 gnl/TRDRNA2_/TRDRNA2_190716_c0~~gnl/TRDRNA2_/TRDRNA2_190716_c0_seq1.p1  ORF type:complete len:196 (+),score=39.96 gnl/TRDRNA2_/TRDRNA2_190716_c0_seq1:128-715(+)
MPRREQENFSLGVTQLLDELLADCGDENVPPPEDAAVSNALQRTAALSNVLDKYMDRASSKDPHAARRREALKDRFEDEEAEHGGRFNDTISSLGSFGSLGCTGGSISDAIRANEARLACVRAGILEELKRREEAGGEDSPRSEISDSGIAPSRAVPGEYVELDSLLSECEAIQAMTKGWRGFAGPPPGWHSVEK